MIKDLILTKQSINTPLFSDYLKKEGYSRQLLYKYVKDGWLENVAKGVYKLKNDTLSPLQIIQAVQQQLHQPIHIAATSALALQGKTHNVQFQEQYFIFASSDCRVMKWLKEYPSFKFIKSNLFKDNTISLIAHNNIMISSQERAMIETVYLIPKQVAYTEGIQLMELLPALRSDVVQNLLEQCTSIVTKRLFLHLAEMCSHQWVSKLNINKIDLGTGVRQLVKQGLYVKKYQLYVPDINE